MTLDRRALIAAIIADPDDDAPRLVYSDWLEENDGDEPCTFCDGTGFRGPSIDDAPKYERRPGPDGRMWVFPIHKPISPTLPICHKCNGDGVISNGLAERAEFIRCQVELARPLACEWMTRGMHCERYNNDVAPYRVIVSCPTCSRIDALRRRERELFSVATRFAIDTTRIWPIEVRRGFIYSITCNAADWIAHADAILAEHPVREATLTDLPNNAFQSGRPVRLIGGIAPGSGATYADACKNGLERRWPGIAFHLPRPRYSRIEDFNPVDVAILGGDPSL